MAFRKPKSDWRRTWSDAKKASLSFFQKFKFNEDLGKALDRLHELVEDYPNKKPGIEKTNQAAVIGLNAEACSNIIKKYQDKVKDFNNAQVRSTLDAALKSIAQEVSVYVRMQDS